MKDKKVMLLIIASFLSVVLVTNISFAQGPTKGQGAQNAPQEGPQTTITGKIVYMKSYGGYVVISETPHEEYKVINEDDKILGDFAKKGKTVTIEGRFPRGAYLLFIEKIDGKKYSAK